jgi:diketogulonate reductase-like aldo/keto reductase
MNVCGIELKASQAILVAMNSDTQEVFATTKIALEKDEQQEEIRQFCNAFLHFLETHNIELIGIKKRAKKGTFSGGAVTFKMEGLIQLNPLCEAHLITAQSLSTLAKSTSISTFGVKKYQETACLTALFLMRNF